MQNQAQQGIIPKVLDRIKTTIRNRRIIFYDHVVRMKNQRLNKESESSIPCLEGKQLKPSG